MEEETESFVQRLRALAAALVVAYHLDGLLYSHDWGITGGWIGVDVFFVLSGYLITTLLLAERATSGTIALRRFTVRRLGGALDDDYDFFSVYYYLNMYHENTGEF